jgi:hypothetical protein
MITEPQPVAAVEAGMKMLAWRYDARVHADRLVHVDRPGSRDTLVPLLGGFGLLALGGAAVTVTDAPVWIRTLVYFAGIVLFGCGRAVIQMWRRWHDDEPREDRPRVVLTSTGVAFGPYARLWSGSEERLVRAWNRVRRKKMLLELEFSGPFSRRTRMTIPVPQELEVAVIDVLQTLKAKIAGTTASADAHERLVARALNARSPE